MTKRYLTDLIYAVVFGLALLSSLGLGIFYIVANNPIAIRNDLQRISDFDSISYKVDTYYSKTQKLPGELKDVEDSSKSYPPTYSPSSIFFGSPAYDYSTGGGKSLYKDPKTKEYYKIEKSDSSSFDYKLCTTFESDWDKVMKYMHGDYSYGYGYGSTSPSMPIVEDAPYVRTDYSYKKGYDCVDYKLTYYGRDLPLPLMDKIIVE